MNSNVYPRTITCILIVCVSLLLTLIPVIYDLTLMVGSGGRITIALLLIVALVVCGILLLRNIYQRAGGRSPRGHELMPVIGAVVIGFIISFAITAVLTVVLFNIMGLTAGISGPLSIDLISGTLLNIILFPIVFLLPMAVIESNISRVRILRAFGSLLRSKYLMLLIISAVTGVLGLLANTYVSGILCDIISAVLTVLLLFLSVEQVLKEITVVKNEN